jgi:hypothetical protein
VNEAHDREQGRPSLRSGGGHPTTVHDPGIPNACRGANVEDYNQYLPDPTTTGEWIRYAGLVPGLLVGLVLPREAAPIAQTPAPAALPARFDHYLSTVVRPAARDRSRLLDGEPITKLLDTDDVSEIGVFGAIWIHASPERYVAAVHDIEAYEHGGAFHVTKRISDPPRLQDFAALTLSPGDVRDLRNCHVGDCKLKLDRASLDAIRTRVDFTKPTAASDAEAVMRERLFAEATAYRADGNTGLPVYQDDSRPMSVATEFDEMIGRMPEFTEWLPELRPYLRGYPAATLPGAVDFLYWQDVSFGLKSTIRMSHVVTFNGPSGTVVASKMLYASHYFRTGLELRVLVTDPARGPGFWFITVNRTRSDGLTGFIGFLVRGHVRSGVQKGALAVLAATKRRLEAAGQ